MSLSRRGVFAAAGILAPQILALPAQAKLPAGYPRSYKNIIAAAEREGRLVVYANTDAASMAGVLNDFRQTYPRIAVAYHELSASDLYRRVIADRAKGAPSADLVWSSAMDLQAKLINDDYAQAYSSPEKPNLPAWAVWKNEGWGVTAEPIVFAYNKRLMPAGDVPTSHAALERLLRTKPQAYRGKVSTYDPAQSGVGFLYLSQDVRVSRDTWKLIRALGGVDPKLYASTAAMIDKLAAGEHLISYNVIGSYVLERAKRNPAIGIVFPADYTQVMSRIAFIAKDARHPNAARLLLDHLLSRRGQQQLAARSLGPVRIDMPNSGVRAPRPDQVQAIPVGPGLLANLDQIKRAKFLRDWNKALQ